MAKKITKKADHPFPQNVFLGTDGDGVFDETSHVLDFTLADATENCEGLVPPCDLVAVYELKVVHRVKRGPVIIETIT